MRIVSLLPSTTEILFAIGAGNDVVGVTFECDFPAEARTRTIVSTSAMPEGLSTKEIDDWVVQAMHRGDDLYHLSENALRDLDAELAALPVDAAGDAIQNLVFAVGKRHEFEPLRNWFRALYETLLGSSQGPRMGSFIALYGIESSRRLIAESLARTG